RRNESRVTLICGVKGGARPDEWKHMLSATEAAESQRKDADRGANLLERQQDRQYLGLGKQEKQGHCPTCLIYLSLFDPSQLFLFVTWKSLEWTGTLIRSTPPASTQPSFRLVCLHLSSCHRSHPADLLVKLTSHKLKEWAASQRSCSSAFSTCHLEISHYHLVNCREEMYPCTRMYSVHRPIKTCLGRLCLYSLPRVYVINNEICVRTVCQQDEYLKAELCRELSGWPRRIARSSSGKRCRSRRHKPKTWANQA
ncbi:hypothetical protein CCH79_00010886, partial [Gambusia affinis]